MPEARQPQPCAVNLPPHGNQADGKRARPRPGCLRPALIRLLLPLLLLFCICALPGEAHAFKITDAGGKPLTLDLENITGVEWHNNHRFDGSGLIDSDDFAKINVRITADLHWDPLLLGLRLEGTGYPDALLRKAPGSQAETLSDNDLRAEKYYFVYSDGAFRLDLGDYYVTFGRGLALSMRRSGDGELDNTLRGVKFEYSSEGTHLAVLGGLSNIINIDPVNQTPQSDPYDLILGMRAEQRLADLFSIGAHAVHARYGIAESAYRRSFIPEQETSVLGVSLEFPDIMEHASFYAEYDHMLRYARKLNQELSDSYSVSDSGDAVYASASFYAGDFTLTAEYKLYQDFIFRRGRTKLSYDLPDTQTAPDGLDFFEDIYYNNAPNLERPDIEFGRDYGNDHGCRLRAEYNSTGTGTVPYAVGYFTVNKWQDQGASSLGGFGTFEPGFKGDRIYHVYGGVTQYVRDWELFIDGGFRDETSRDTGDGIKRVMHLKSGFSGPLAARHVLGFESFIIRRDYMVLKQLEDDYDFTLSYDFTGWFALSFFYTLQFLDFVPSAGDDELKHFFAGEIATRFSDIVEFSIFGGQIRESYRCYGGFCRKVPPFEGVKGKLRIHY